MIWDDNNYGFGAKMTIPHDANQLNTTQCYNPTVLQYEEEINKKIFMKFIFILICTSII